MNTKDRYDDIINLPHYVSSRRAQMPNANRAAQFAPFAALTGYDAVLDEAMRQTYERICYSIEMQEELNAQLVELIAKSKERPEVVITYFVDDTKKSGGTFVTVAGNLRFYDECAHTLVLTNNKKIPVDQVVSLA